MDEGWIVSILFDFKNFFKNVTFIKGVYGWILFASLMYFFFIVRGLVFK